MIMIIMITIIIIMMIMIIMIMIIIIIKGLPAPRGVVHRLRGAPGLPLPAAEADLHNI